MSFLNCTLTARACRASGRPTSSDKGAGEKRGEQSKHFNIFRARAATARNYARGVVGQASEFASVRKLSAGNYTNPISISAALFAVRYRRVTVVARRRARGVCRFPRSRGESESIAPPEGERYPRGRRFTTIKRARTFCATERKVI